MTQISSLQVVRDAAREHRGVAAFNVIHLEHAEAFAAAAARTGLPIIMQLSHNAIRYHGSLAPIAQAMLAVARGTDAPLAVHLDHCESVELAKEAIDLGFSSVMYDGSTLPTEENLARTAEVVDYAHEHGVDVEAELGEIGGKRGAHTPGVRTDPDEAVWFVEHTGVDMLAVAVGSEHAMAERTAKLDLDLIAHLHEALSVPLVLHGSSGVPDSEIQAGIAAGMTKINVSTHLNGFFTRSIREILEEDPALTDSRKYVGPGRDAVAAEAARLQQVFHDPQSAL